MAAIPMIVLHVPFGYFPDPCGGTEVYVASLCRELSPMGVQSRVAAPGRQAQRYVHEGIPVHRLPVRSDLSLEELSEHGDELTAGKMAELLDEERPQLVHFHAQSPALSLPVLREVRQRGIPTIFTYHTPTVSCNRGSLMRWGEVPCDGRMVAGLCAACQMHSLGVPKFAATLLAQTSRLTRPLSRWLPHQARFQVPVAAYHLAATRHQNAHAWFAGMDRIIALCAWTKRLLELNSVPRSKIRKVRHGLTQICPPLAPRSNSPSKPVRLVFLGRLDPNKGLHLVLDALALAPELAVRLDVYTVIESRKSRYAVAMSARLVAEPRVQVCPPVAPDKVIETLQEYDALLVPSIWLETGPLVVLEAFAAGLPVIGSGFGGIAEWVMHERNGLLVGEPSATAWSQALKRVADNPHLITELRDGIEMPRSMSDVAKDVAAVYRELVPEGATKH